MRNEYRLFYQKVPQSGGTAGTPAVSAPIHLPDRSMTERTAGTGLLSFCLSGVNGASGKVQGTINPPQDVEAGSAIWVDLDAYTAFTTVAPAVLKTTDVYVTAVRFVSHSGACLLQVGC